MAFVYTFVLFFNFSYMEVNVITTFLKEKSYVIESQLLRAVCRQPSVWLSHSDLCHIFAEESNKHMASLHSAGTGPFVRKQCGFYVASAHSSIY
jgi:hypothetical protein